MSDNSNRFGNWQDEIGNAVQDLTILTQAARPDARLPRQAALTDVRNIARPRSSSSSSSQLQRINGPSGSFLPSADHEQYVLLRMLHIQMKDARGIGAALQLLKLKPEIVAEPPLRPLESNTTPNGADTLTMEVHFSGWHTLTVGGDGSMFPANDDRARVPTEHENLRDRLQEVREVVPDVVAPFRQMHIAAEEPRVDLDESDGFIFVERTVNEDDEIN
ncbi:unnamed protein product, partial [Mesorhabditis spiculigera]